MNRMISSLKGESPKSRFFFGFFGGRKGGRISVGNPTSIACRELMKRTGAHFPEGHLDAEVMAALSVAGHTILGFDTVMPVFSVQHEAEALGCLVDWGDSDRMPDVRSHEFTEPEKIIIPKSYLEKPSIQVVLDAISILRRELGNSVAILGKVIGPWTLSYHLAGVENFLLWTLLDPDKVRRYLNILKEIVVIFAIAQFRAGADMVTIADHAAGDLISRRMYDDFLLPIHKEILKRVGGPMILHMCGNCIDRLSSFLDAGFIAYHFESKTSIQQAIDIVSRKMTLIGNINNSEILLNGTPKTIYDHAKYIIESGVDILAPECAIPLGTPICNLRAIVETAKSICTA